MLLTVWLAICLLLPRVGADVAARLAPVPSFAEFWSDIADDQAKGIDGHNDQNVRTEALREEVFAQYGVKRIEDLPLTFRGLSLQADEEYGNQVFDRRYGQLWEIYRRQDELQVWIGLFSPLTPLRKISMSIADTGLDEYERFASAAENFRRKMIRQLNNELAATRPGQAVARDSTYWTSLPEFHYTGSAQKTKLRAISLLALARRLRILRFNLFAASQGMDFCVARRAFVMEFRLLGREPAIKILLAATLTLSVYSVWNGAMMIWRRVIADTSQARTKKLELVSKWRQEVDSGNFVTSGARGSKADSP